MREAKNPPLDMSLFHFISLAEQSGPATNAERQFVFQTPRQNDTEGATGGPNSVGVSWPLNL